MKLLQLLLILVAFHSVAYARSAKIAFIYHGPGVCDGCAEAAGELVQHHGFKVEFIMPGEYTKLKGARSALYVQPGGNDRPTEILDALKPGEVDLLKAFIAGGGRYLGICSGGYLAGQRVTDVKTSLAFGLLPLDEVDEEDTVKTPMVKPVLWNGVLHQIYFQDGPSFKAELIPGAEIWGIYQQTGHAAAMITTFGKGRVGVIGPHIEAAPDWFVEDKLTDPGSKYDLGGDFFKSLMN